MKKKKPLLSKSSRPDWTFEQDAHTRGWCKIAGVDEAGRGPLAGPVVAAACILPRDFPTHEINDSKKLTEIQREQLYRALTSSSSVVWGVGVIGPEIIDSINIYQATIRAMLEAVCELNQTPDGLLVDGLALPHPHLPVQKIIRGDSKSLSIAAASILAKVTRDAIMKDLDATYPGYGFAQHKGYPTRAHKEAIAKLGVSPVHRKTFRVS